MTRGLWPGDELAVKATGLQGAMGYNLSAETEGSVRTPTSLGSVADCVLYLH